MLRLWAVVVAVVVTVVAIAITVTITIRAAIVAVAVSVLFLWSCGHVGGVSSLMAARRARGSRGIAISQVCVSDTRSRLHPSGIWGVGE